MSNIPPDTKTESNAAPEYWDLYDRKGNFVRTMRRGEGFVPPELYHITVEVIATDFKGHILVTQRSMEKRRDGGFWEFPAGSVLSGEQPHDAALRELREETGLKPERLRKFHKSLIPGMLRIAYFAEVPNLCNAAIQLQKGETMAYRVITIPQWYELMSGRQFSVSRMKSYTEKFFSAVEANVGVCEPPTVSQETPAKQKTFQKVKFGEE